MLESLPALGVIDIGSAIDVSNCEPQRTKSRATELGPTLRLTPRGRALFSAANIRRRAHGQPFIDNQVLRLGPQTREALRSSDSRRSSEIGKVAGKSTSF